MSNMKKIPDSVDVVVVGGGIIGCSTAYYLARSGVRVALCEKGRIAGEQSSRNWGFIRKQGRDQAELPLMIHSLGLWHDFVAALNEDIGFYVGGTIYLSATETRHKDNLAWLEIAKAHDLDTQYLTQTELHALVPDIHGQSCGALFTPSDARAEPGLATRAIANQARARGTVLLEQCAVRGLDIVGGGVAGVVTEYGRIKSSAVVCAGGAWSSYFCRHIDLLFPQLKVIGSVMATVPGQLVAQQSVWSNGLGLRRRMDGGYNVAYGGSSSCQITPDYIRFLNAFFGTWKNSKEEVSVRFGKRFFTELRWPSKWSFDKITPFEKERMLNPAPDMDLLDKAYHRMAETFPALQGIAVSQRWAGMIDVTPDELPIISNVEHLPGLTVSTGYSGHGFGIGLGAGQVTAQLVTGQPLAVDIAPLSLNRFSC